MSQSWGGQEGLFTNITELNGQEAPALDSYAEN